AMYRAVTLFFIRAEVDYTDEAAVTKALEQIQIHFERVDGKNTTFLNGENVETEIRKMYVAKLVSSVAAISAVRAFLVCQQKDMGQQKAVILDGRDIGTVVFPAAALKIFLTASPEERAHRRHAELLEKGQTTSYEAVLQNLQERDHLDSNRADSPLRQAEDAVRIDNTNLTRAEQQAMVLALVNCRR
ncbi:MAG: (d)CMP kinase, partial [Bacteroidota bacterium]